MVLSEEEKRVICNLNTKWSNRDYRFVEEKEDDAVYEFPDNDKLVIDVTGNPELYVNTYKHLKYSTDRDELPFELTSMIVSEYINLPHESSCTKMYNLKESQLEILLSKNEEKEISKEFFNLPGYIYHFYLWIFLPKYSRMKLIKNLKENEITKKTIIKKLFEY